MSKDFDLEYRGEQGFAISGFPREKFLLRGAEFSDFDRLRKIHHDTLRDHIEKIWGWDKSFQDNYFKENFHLQNLWVIHDGDISVGYIEYRMTKKEVLILNILLISDYQGLGLGTEILKKLIDMGMRKSLSIKLGVFQVNTRAKSLYERIGFRTVEETETHFLMQYANKN